MSSSSSSDLTQSVPRDSDQLEKEIREKLKFYNEQSPKALVYAGYHIIPLNAALDYLNKAEALTKNPENIQKEVIDAFLTAGNHLETQLADYATPRDRFVNAAITALCKEVIERYKSLQKEYQQKPVSLTEVKSTFFTPAAQKPKEKTCAFYHNQISDKKKEDIEKKLKTLEDNRNEILNDEILNKIKDKLKDKLKDKKPEDYKPKDYEPYLLDYIDTKEYFQVLLINSIMALKDDDISISKINASNKCLADYDEQIKAKFYLYSSTYNAAKEIIKHAEKTFEQSFPHALAEARAKAKAIQQEEQAIEQAAKPFSFKNKKG